MTVRVKPEHLEAFLRAACQNADSARNEPGCLRFDVVHDRDDPHWFYFYEVYRDDAALAAHRETPHFKAYIETATPWMAMPAERRLGTNVTPSDADWR
ncbi:MAG: putative quinol monooxygenase [Acidobacteria bacterium]|nr:putative quinol monooxygenase [Acidobacteriota bacterium]